MPEKIPHLIVEVFSGQWFTGKRGVLISPVKFTGDIGFQDNISSIKIYKGPLFKRNTKYKGIFCEHINFQGRRLVLGPGYYGNIHEMGGNFGDKISSIDLKPMQDESGPEWGGIPLIVEVFQDIDFKGRKATLLRDVPDTNLIRLQQSISSVRISKGPNCPREGAAVVFYQEPNYGGAALTVRIGPEDPRKNIKNLHILPESFGDKIASIKIEAWASSGEFTESIFEDEFSGRFLKHQWMWIDPEGGGQWEEEQGFLRMQAESGHDLNRRTNFNAPRLVVATTGDFAIETAIKVSNDLVDHGGLLVWRAENSFLRLEKTSVHHEFKGDVAFTSHRWGRNLIGRVGGLQRVYKAHLRIERRGNQFTGLASADGISWRGCGTAVVGMGEPIEVGLFAIAPGENATPTVTRFDYFRLFRRASDFSRYTPQQRKEIAGRPDMERLTALRSWRS